MTQENKKYKKTSYTFKTEEDVLNFGVNKGIKIGEIMKTQPEYIEWCIKNFKGFKLCKKLNKIFEERNS